MALYQIEFPARSKKMPEQIEADFVWMKDGAACFRLGRETVRVIAVHHFADIKMIPAPTAMPDVRVPIDKIPIDIPPGRKTADDFLGPQIPPPLKR